MGKLEINQNDQNLNTNQIPASRNTFKRAIAGLLTFCTLYSGSLIGPLRVNAKETESTSQSQSYDYENPKTIIEIPDSYKWEVSYACGKETSDEITIGDLQNASSEELSIRILDNSSLEWLNYIKNVKKLKISLSTDDCSALREVKKLQDVVELQITTPINIRASVTKEDFAFLKNTTTLQSLDLSLCSVEKGVLEELTQLDTLCMQSNANYGTDFKKLTFLRELDTTRSGPYDVAIDLTKETYETLKKSGVKITFNSPEEEKIYKEINEELEQVVESLNLSPASTEQEKLDAILIHVLDKLIYDKEVSAALRNNTEHLALTNSFYIDGYLYGALEKDSAICGNYAAYVQALANRVNLSSYFLESYTHAWNLVVVDGEEYYVDATWMDEDYIYVEEETIHKQGNVTYASTTLKPIQAQEAIIEGKTENIEWYMADPENYPYYKTHTESHEEINLPKFIQVTPKMSNNQPEETINETTSNNVVQLTEQNETIETSSLELTEEDKFEVNISGKKWIVPATVAIGIMAGLGGAVAVNSSKKKSRSKRRNREMDDMFADFDKPRSSSSTSYTTDDTDDLFADMFDDSYSGRNRKTSKDSRRR